MSLSISALSMSLRARSKHIFGCILDLTCLHLDIVLGFDGDIDCLLLDFARSPFELLQELLVLVGTG